MIKLTLSTIIAIFLTVDTATAKSDLEYNIVKNDWCRKRIISGQEQIVMMRFLEQGIFSVVVFENNAPIYSSRGRWKALRSTLTLMTHWSEDRAEVAFFEREGYLHMKVREHSPKRGSGRYTFFDCSLLNKKNEEER